MVGLQGSDGAEADEPASIPQSTNIDEAIGTLTNPQRVDAPGGNAGRASPSAAGSSRPRSRPAPRRTKR